MIINEFSKFLINLKFEDIPKESIEKAKLCFLDYISVYKRGLYEESSKIAIKTFNLKSDFSVSDFSNHNSEVYNLNYPSSMLNNGLIKGIASHSLDLDDGHRLAFLHPGVIVFSAALAILEDKTLRNSYSFSSKDFLESVIIGYELAVILGKLVNPIHRNQGFHSTGTIGSFIAGAVASKLLKLDFNQTVNCLGLCGTQSSGLLESDHAGSMGKTLHAGKAVYNGLLSAILAKNGFTGAESTIEGNEGFLNALVCNLEDNFDFNQFLDDNLGKFHINDVYLKKYSFCRHIHSAIDATLYLRNQLINNQIFDSYLNSNLIKDLVESIIKIDVETYKIASEHDNYSPKSKQALKQSLPYAIAIYLVCGDLILDKIDNLTENGLLDNLDNNQYYFDDNFDDSDFDYAEVNLIKNIVNKINIIENNDLELLTPDKRPSKVIIYLNDDFKLDNSNSYNNHNNLNNSDNLDNLSNLDKSKSDLKYEKTVFYPLGESENSLLWDDILDKFYNLNSNYDLTRLEMIKYMENKDINEILSLLLLY